MKDLIRNPLDIEGATERIDPDREPPGILSIHLKRYEFALSYCKGKQVLDAACGVGYGTNHLAQVASSIVGIDINPEAIAYGRARFESDRLNFQIANVMETGFLNAQFDVICSFETIEHLPNIPAYLKEMVRILRPDGFYIVSTPQVSKINHRPNNPYHTIEFSRADFETLLHQYFDQVEIFGERRKESELHYWLTRLFDVTGLRGRIPGLGLRRFVNQALQTTPFEEMLLEDLTITKEKIERASDLIAVCKNPK